MNNPQFNQYFSETSKSLISGLLTKDPSKRLGCKLGFKDIKDHPYFENIKWNEVFNK